MSAEGVAVIPQSKECRKVWLPADRWQAFCLDDGPPEKKLVFCCRQRAGCEFGDFGVVP